MILVKEIILLYFVEVFGFILGFYICYSGWVIGGKNSTSNIMKNWIDYWRKK